MFETPKSENVAGSYGHDVINWALRVLHIDLEPWQRYSVIRILEHDAVGKLIARQLLISVARQNGKSVIVRVIMGWVLDEGHKIPALQAWYFMLLAAHDASQARIPYDFIRRDLISHAGNKLTYGHRARKVEYAGTARATLFTGIEYNGVRIDVTSRNAGAARGHSAGLVAFDEVLTQTDFEQVEVLLPMLSAIPNSQMLMTSTAGFGDSVVLRAAYDRTVRYSTGEEDADPRFLGIWWCATHDDVGLEWDELEKANPSLVGNRLSRDSIEAEYLILPKGSWIRERLNRWSDERVDAPFSMKAWGYGRIASGPLDPAEVESRYVIGVDCTSIWSEGTIVVAAMRRDGRVGVEVHRHLNSRPNLPLRAQDFVTEIEKINDRVDVQAIVYNLSSVLAPGFERHKTITGLPYQAISSQQNVVACVDFAEAVTSKRIAHNDPFLDGQMSKAQRRMIGGDGAWRWAISKTPITGIIAATLAAHTAARATKPIQLFV
jgi:hypothetical protein